MDDFKYEAIGTKFLDVVRMFLCSSPRVLPVDRVK